MKSMAKYQRCEWCDDNSELYKHYHDTQWGVPVFDDNLLFEMLILEGMQAGLSWITVLKKKENFRIALDNFDAKTIAQYGPEKIEQLMENTGIIRNRLKLEACIKNAKAFLTIQTEQGSFSDYLWTYVDHKPIQNSFETLAHIPAKTDISEKISKDLKKRGMNFVGPTIIYAFMQAIGMVNDHQTDCFRYQEIKALSTKKS